MPILKRLCAFVFLLGFPVIFFGQGESVYLHRLTVADGLSEGTNQFLYKDSKGFVWLSSINGLNRYDGYQVKVFKPDPGDPASLHGQNIQSDFFEDANSNIWFTTYERLNCYIRNKDQFISFSVGNNNGHSPLGNYAFHLDGDQNLWIIVDANQLYHFNIETKTFKRQHQLLLPALRAFHVADTVSGIDQVFYYVHKKPGIVKAAYLAGQLVHQEVLLAAESNEPISISKVVPVAGSLWMATDNGLAKYDLSTARLEFFDKIGGNRLGVCNTLEQIDDQTMLVAFAQKGVYYFNPVKRQFGQPLMASLFIKEVADLNNVSEIALLRDGGIWMSVGSEGVEFFYPEKQKFNVIKPSAEILMPSANFDVSAMGGGRTGMVWFGTTKEGVLRYDLENDKYERITQAQSAGTQQEVGKIQNIFEDRLGRVWILDWKGTKVWLPDKSKIVQAFDQDNSVYLYGVQLADGRIILAAYVGGLFEVIENKKGVFKLVPIPQHQSPLPFISLWQNQEGKLFGCQALKSIVVMDPADGFKQIQEIELPGESRSFCERQGDPSIWVANSYGLVQLNWDGNQYQHTLFNEKEGLTNAVVQSVLTDASGKIWVSTGNGISAFDPATSQFTNYGIADGISHMQFNTGSCLALENGRLLFGSVNGITAFYPEQVKPLDVPAYPTITNILINDQVDSTLVCQSTGARNISQFQSISLDYLYNTISFNFAALDYSHPASNEFMYKMEGIDQDWVRSGKENFARYARLPPGQYVFKLKATNSDGIWSNERHLLINIRPPFTQTPLFYFLIGAAVMGLGWLVYWLMKRRKENLRRLAEEKRIALELERQRIARDVHDDLGSGLSALSLLTEIAKYKSSPDELKEEITKINLSARELSGKIREVIWTVSAGNDSLSSLISYLNQYAVELFDNVGVDCQLSLPENIPAQTISGEHRRTLFLAFKEALNNITKHAEATEVKIEFVVDEAQLKLVITDNGNGFDPALLLNSAGNGLRNMQARMRDIGGNCEFKTDRSGTTVIFTFVFKPS